MTEESAPGATYTQIWPTTEEFSAAELADLYRAPGVRSNMVTSIDGSLTIGGRAGGLSDPVDFEHLLLARESADVLLVGAGTARAEGYGPVTARDKALAGRRAAGQDDHPALALVSASLDLDPSSPMFTDAPHRPLVLTHTPDGGADADWTRRREALADVAEVVLLPGPQAAAEHGSAGGAAIVAALRERGHTRILTEGGPALLGTLVTDGALEELLVSYSPTVAGGDGRRMVTGAPESPRGARLVLLLKADDLLIARYRMR